MQRRGFRSQLVAAATVLVLAMGLCAQRPASSPGPAGGGTPGSGGPVGGGAPPAGTPVGGSAPG